MEPTKIYFLQFECKKSRIKLATLVARAETVDDSKVRVVYGVKQCFGDCP